jgi:ABC-type multidrug transport system fused ATPase/permease subunit
MDDIQSTIRIGPVDDSKYDIVFLDLNLTVEDSNAIRVEYKNIGWKRFIPLRKRLVPKFEKKIIQNVSGVFRFKRFTAIMGSSGAGKTSLLTLIAGQLSKDSKTTGTLFVKGHSFDNKDGIKNLSGFVFQASSSFVIQWVICKLWQFPCLAFMASIRITSSIFF